MTGILKVDTIQNNDGSIPTAKQLGLNTTGNVLQVIQTVMSDNYIYSTTSPVDLPGLAATITPISTSSKILISCVLHYGQGADSDIDDFAVRLRIKRNGTALSYTQDSNRMSGDYAVYKATFNKLQMEVAYFQRLDSPNTSSALTYQIQLSTGTWSTNVVGINRPFRFDDNDYVVSRARSTITLMEIAG